MCSVLLCYQFNTSVVFPMAHVFRGSGARTGFGRLGAKALPHTCSVDREDRLTVLEQFVRCQASQRRLRDFHAPVVRSKRSVWEGFERNLGGRDLAPFRVNLAVEGTS